MIDIDSKEMRERALGWLTNRYTGAVTTREKAIGEEHLALDVLDLLEERARVQMHVRELSSFVVEARRKLEAVRAELRRETHAWLKANSALGEVLDIVHRLLNGKK